MRKYLMLLFLFLGSACISLSGTSTSPLSITQTPELGVGYFPTATSLPEALLSDLVRVAPQYTVSVLSCENYVETSWGNGGEQWGPSIDFSGELQRRFFPPVFNSDSELYIYDFVNRRLLKYDGNTTNPAQVILLPDHYFTFPTSSAITITNDSIIIPYGVNMIGIMSLDGQVTKDIQLPKGYTYNLMAPGWFLAWVDERGGLFVKSNKSVYFDVGWRDGQWHKISEGEFFVRPFLWQDYIGDMNTVQPVIRLYTLNPLTDFWAEPTIEVDMGLNTGFYFIGADKNGRAYMQIFSDTMQALYMRYSISDGTRHFGIVEDGIREEQIIQSGVAPDGTIYLIIYEPEDATVQPKIVNCHFPED